MLLLQTWLKSKVLLNHKSCQINWQHLFLSFYFLCIKLKITQFIVINKFHLHSNFMCFYISICKTRQCFSYNNCWNNKLYLHSLILIFFVFRVNNIKRGFNYTVVNHHSNKLLLSPFFPLFTFTWNMATNLIINRKRLFSLLILTRKKLSCKLNILSIFL